MIRTRHSLVFFLSFLVLTTQNVTAQYIVKDPNAVTLHGEWFFALDPVAAGEMEEWYLSTKSLQRWDKVNVPHCFSADPRYHYFTGPTWYRKSFRWEPDADKRTILHFDGVYYECSVWLNNKKVGDHEGGYTPFQFDISDHLISGENHIAVRVDNNTWKPGTIPGAKGQGPGTEFPGWLNYGGITRPVYLTLEP